MITRKDAISILNRIQEIKNNHPIIDVHAHPFEIIFGSLDYERMDTQNGLYRTGTQIFKAPELTDVKISPTPRSAKIEKLFMQPQTCRRRMASMYACTGPYVFDCEMEIGKVDQVLLLPVASPCGSINSQMETMYKMYGDNRRFLLGWSADNEMEDHEIETGLRKAIEAYSIRAVKVHPNISRLNLGTKTGVERLEFILSACDRFEMPVIVHGGRSPVLKDSMASEYGCLQNLNRVNWNLTKWPVIIAHAGTYGCTPAEVESSVLPLLTRMLSSYDHLAVDVSAMSMSNLSSILDNVDTSRIVFGSDALYEHIWISLVKLYYSLQQAGECGEDRFFQIACHNPKRWLNLKADSDFDQ